MLNPDPFIEGVENISLPKIILTSRGGLLRIGVPKDGSCLFHAVIRAFNKDYVDGTSKQRYDMVRKLRFDLTNDIVEKVTSEYCDNPSYTGKTYYEIIGDGNLAELGKHMYEYSIKGIKHKLRSMQSVGMEFLEMLSIFLKLDIYIINLGEKDLYYMGKDVSNCYKKRQSIVLAYIQNENKTDGHYEVIGLNIKDVVYTIFEPDNFFIVALRERHSALSSMHNSV